MEDSACDGEQRLEHESIWVWIKPAAFYNQIESRYKTNRYLLRRNLSYLRRPTAVQKRSGSNVEFRISDFIINSTTTTTTTTTNQPIDAIRTLENHQRQISKLSVFVVICEQLSEREFNPFFVKLVHLKQNESTTFHFDLEDLDPQLLTVLLIIRDGLYDLSILHKEKTISISPNLTKKSCFGFIPVGSTVWWYAHGLRLTTPKVRVHRWETGTVTLGEKSIWNGFQNRNFKMLSLENSMNSIPVFFSPSFSLQKHIRRTTSLLMKTSGELIKDNEKENEVAFRFMFDRLYPQCVEQRTTKFGCPFCPTHCNSVQGLRYHLTASHDLFFYELEVREMTIIWVKRRMDVYDANGEIFCPHTRRLIDSIEKVFYMNQAAYLRSKPVVRKRKTESWNRLLEFDDKQSSTSSRRRLNQPNRLTTRMNTRAQSSQKPSRHGTQSLLDSSWMFYHSRTALPMTEDEIKNGPDTDDEADEKAWEVSM
eukprot:g6302.t1